jgi:hypothetical protein
MDDGLPDLATLEWWESEEFPRRALRAEASSKASECPALGELPSPATADWLSSQQWPTYPLLCSEQHTTPLSANVHGRVTAQPIAAARSSCSYRGSEGHTQGRKAAINHPTVSLTACNRSARLQADVTFPKKSHLGKEL